MSMSLRLCGLRSASPPRADTSSALNANTARAPAVRRSMAANPLSLTRTIGAVRPCLERPPAVGMGATDQNAFEMATAVHRAEQQHGQLVPSIIHQGHRIRAVGNLIHRRPPTETFHEFLVNIVKWTVGEGWYKAQLALPEGERHQILRWIVSHGERTRTIVGDDRFRDGDAYVAPPTGDGLSLVMLGYDLLHLQHRGDLPQSLVKRLKNRAEFQGALYEIAIAATFVRAHFTVKFIDDKRKKHPEFIARDPGTAARVAVETKSRRRAGVLHETGEIDEARALRGDVEHLLNEAFEQAPGDCPFMIFVDVNVPPVPGIPFHERAWFQDVWAAVQALGEPTPEKPDTFNALVLTTFPFRWEGANPATLAEAVSMLPMHTRHPLPQEVVGRIVSAIQDYGHFPREM